jgi:hypothetical protein
LHGHVKIGYKVPQKMLSFNNVTDHVIIRCIRKKMANNEHVTKRQEELNG